LEQKDQSQLGVNQVLATIRQGTLEWPRDRLRVCRNCYKSLPFIFIIFIFIMKILFIHI